MHIDHIRTQHGVGKGSFHSGVFFDWENHKTLFSYVYDCGGRKDLVEEGIQRLKRQLYLPTDNVLDMLVISHFDVDHIGHIKTLMQSFDRVNYVVLPYLSELEELILLFEFLKMDDADESSFTDSQDYAQLIEAPVSWLTELGANYVIRIRDGGEASGSLDIPPPEPKFEDRLPLKPDTGLTLGDNVINHTTQFPIDPPIFSHLTKQWLFKFHTKPADQEQMEKLAEKLLDIIGLDKSKVSDTDTSEEVKNKIEEFFTDRERLKEIQTAIRVTLGTDASNRYSLCMYSGPIADHNLPIGWVGTGDAVLKQTTGGSLIEFKRHYKRLLKNVSTIQAPHHGSEKNYDANFVRTFSNSIVTSSAHSNNKGHPSPQLITQCTSSGSLFVEVNEKEVRYSSFRQPLYAHIHCRWPIHFHHLDGMHIRSQGNNYIEKFCFY